MNSTRLIRLVVLLLSTGSLLKAAPLGTSFTYQGKLTDGSAPANGRYDLVFTLYDAASSATNVVSAFVWADTSMGPTIYAEFHSMAANSFNVRATGGVRLVTGVDTNGTPIHGATLAPNGVSWGTVCDQNAKEYFRPVDEEAILEQLACIPVQRWKYKGEDEQATSHLGPVAQDFKAAFYPGRDDRVITTLEFDGVELAAIQGLNRKLEENVADLRAENAALKRELTELRNRMDALVRK